MTRVAIVTTTIRVPEVMSHYVADAREAGLDFALYIVGDRKTPDLADFARKLGPEARWLPPAEHERWTTSGILRWNCIMRRNIGFLAAAAEGPFDFYLSLDDDNVPDPGYFKTFLGLLSRPAPDEVDAPDGWFNYFQNAETQPNVIPFPRGFPVRKRAQAAWEARSAAIEPSAIWAFQGLSWGDPDADAFTHIVSHVRVKRFATSSVVALDAWSPINSQNTFVRERVLPLFLMFDQIGRFDDILAGYLLQRYVYANAAAIHFGVPFTRQERGVRDWLRDFEHEVEGHLTIEALLDHIRKTPVEGLSAMDAMRRFFSEAPGAPAFFDRHRPLVYAWLADLEKIGGGRWILKPSE